MILSGGFSRPGSTDRPTAVPRYLYKRAFEWAYPRVNRLPSQKTLVEDLLGDDEFVLVVLDACRYDYFESEYADYLSGDLRRVWSPASRTPLWVPAMWSDREFDLTYVSSNVYVGDFEYEKNDVRHRADEHIREVVSLWKTHWDGDVDTVRASDVTDTALAAAARDGPTRVVAHYLQPHEPYIGEDGFSKWAESGETTAETEAESDLEDRESFLEDREEVSIPEIRRYDITWGERKQYDLSTPSANAKRLIREGVIDDEDLHAAYLGNLRYVLEDVRRLVERVDCPVVVTADHGELLGEDGRYRHPSRVPHPLLREVPWFTVSEEIVGTAPNDVAPREGDSTTVDDDTVEERLESLGYR